MKRKPYDVGVVLASPCVDDDHAFECGEFDVARVGWVFDEREDVSCLVLDKRSEFVDGLAKWLCEGEELGDLPDFEDIASFDELRVHDGK